jgi:hypothetical protein
VNPETLVAALQSLPPDQLQTVLAQVQAKPPIPPDPAVTAAKPEGFAAMSAEEMSACIKKMSDDYSAAKKMFSEKTEDLEKRFSAMEALTTSEQKKSDEHQMAAFSADFDAIFTRNDNGRRVQPISREAMKKVALATYAAKTFSADMTPAKYLQEIETSVGLLPIDPRMTQIPVAKQGGQTVAHNPILAEMVRPGGALDRWAPKVAAAHRN